jgi:hypothetical protein
MRSALQPPLDLTRFYREGLESMRLKGDKMRWALSILLLVLLGGCMTPPTPLAYRSKYYGLQADAFFVEWGAPVSKHQLADGSWVYLWYTGRNSAYVPGHTDSELIGNTAWWDGYTLRKYMTNLECGVRIYTHTDGTISAILLKEANKGWYENLRCREVFGPPLAWKP